jgi:type I restriction enzyme S subunit
VTTRTVALSECCEIVSGATPSTTVDEYWDGDICWATPKDLSELDSHYISDTPRKLTQAGLASCAAAVLPPNSVLFSSRAPIGHVAVNTVPMATNQGFKSFVPRKDVLDSKFLFHWLRANRPYLESLGNGATFKEVSKAIVSRVRIPFPSLPEQRRIAAILDRADALIAKRREGLTDLETLRQSIFLETFGDPACNSKGFTSGTVGDALRSGWLVDLQDGNHGERHPKSSDFVPDGLPFVMANCLVDGRIDLDKAYKLDRAWLKRLRVGFARPNDVLLSHKGTVGEVAVVPADCESPILSPQVTYYRANEQALNVQFLAGFFRTRWFQSVLAKDAVQSTRAYIGITRQKLMPMLFPPLGLQEQYAHRIDHVNALGARFRASFAELDALFASLQHRAFRGRL